MAPTNSNYFQSARPPRASALPLKKRDFGMSQGQLSNSALEYRNTRRPGRRNGLIARTKELHRSGASNNVAPIPVSCRGLREDETRWRTGLPGACEPW